MTGTLVLAGWLDAVRTVLCLHAAWASGCAVWLAAGQSAYRQCAPAISGTLQQASTCNAHASQLSRSDCGILMLQAGLCCSPGRWCSPSSCSTRPACGATSRWRTCWQRRQTGASCTTWTLCDPTPCPLLQPRTTRWGRNRAGNCCCVPCSVCPPTHAHTPVPLIQTLNPFLAASLLPTHPPIH